MEYLECTIETLVFDILISWNILVPTTKKYCDINATLACIGMDENFYLRRA